jgi:hypothetical protein
MLPNASASSDGSDVKPLVRAIERMQSGLGTPATGKKADDPPA